MPDSVNMVFKKGTSNKFYYLQIVGDKLIASYGKTGTLGVQRIVSISKNKAFLQSEMLKLTELKLRKGYERTGTDSMLASEFINLKATESKGNGTVNDSDVNQFQLKRMIKID